MCSSEIIYCMERKCRDIRYVFQRIILKRTSTEAHVYMRRHQGANYKHFDVSDVVYHKFSHVTASYTLSEENINAMLECGITEF